MNGNIHTAHGRNGISPFPVYVDRSLTKAAPQRPKDGHSAIALINGESVEVMWDAGYGSYVQPRFRFHN